MIFKSLPQSWLCVWLSCVLSVFVPATPVLVSFFPDEARCEESDPTDTSEESKAEEVTLSDSNRVQGRSRREQTRLRRVLQAAHNAGGIRSSLCLQRPLPGQASLWGRRGPLHC